MDYNSMDYPAQRDFVKELAVACRKAGLGLFIYYSVGIDWHHPYFLPNTMYDPARPHYKEVPESYRFRNVEDFKHYLNYAKTQIMELCTQYGPIAGIWFDTVGGVYQYSELFNIQEIYDMIHQIQPHALVVFKTGANGNECVIGVLNIGIEQFALFVQVLGLLLERGLNATTAQALADNGQIARLCLAHKQVEHVTIDQARRIALADCRPNCAHQLADRLHARYHAQEQKAAHLAICQRLLGRELLAKGSLLEHASAVNAAFILCHRLIVKGTAQRAFDQAAQDAEQVLVIERHLVFGRTTHKDQHGGCPIALDRVSPTDPNDPHRPKEVQAAQA